MESNIGLRWTRFNLTGQLETDSRGADGQFPDHVGMGVKLIFGSSLSSTWACLVSRFSRVNMTELLISSLASFQGQDYHSLQFPSAMYVDYVRLYQRQGLQNALTCDPPGHPTADYITKYVILGVVPVLSCNLSIF